MTAIENKFDTRTAGRNGLGYSETAGYCSTGARYNPVPGIRRSFPDTEKRFVTPSGTGKHIKYGDRIFARVVMHGRTIVEFMIASVNDLTELFGELRRHARGVRGLASLYVRNVSRGWSFERPLMLYNDSFSNSYGYSASAVTSGSPRSEERKMLFPWETH